MALRRLSQALLLTTLLAVLAAGCLPAQSPAAATPAQPTDLHDLDQLRRDFEAAAGKPRLILLLSPT